MEEDATRRKSALEGSRERVLEEDFEEESGEGLHESSLVANCVEHLIVKSGLTLGVIDGVFPTTAWHVGTLAQVAWMVSEKKFCDESGVGMAGILGLIKIPEEPVDAIIIIGPLSCLLKGLWSCLSLRVAVSILPLHPRRGKGRKKPKPHYEKDFSEGFVVSKHFLSHDKCGGVTDRQF